MEIQQAEFVYDLSRDIASLSTLRIYSGVFICGLLNALPVFIRNSRRFVLAVIHENNHNSKIHFLLGH